MRLSSNSSLLPILRKHGYPLEPQLNFDGTEDHSTMVATFPCKFPSHTVFAKDCSAIEQLNYVKRLQKEWSDNSVSCTVYYKKQELPEIKQWLADNFNDNIKSVSFLLHSEHGFAQAPYEEISKQEYDKLVDMVTPITNINIEEDSLEVEECESGHCPIK